MPFRLVKGRKAQAGRVAVMRGLNLGDWTWAFAGHLAVLVAMSVAGLTVTAHRIRRLLLP